jgi:hypothetical protein
MDLLTGCRVYLRVRMRETAFPGKFRNGLPE